MSANKYNIREICGDWALDIHWGNKTITLFFNSRNNAELVKSILEWEDNHPNAAVPYKPTLTQPNELLTLEELRKIDTVIPLWVHNLSWGQHKPRLMLVRHVTSNYWSCVDFDGFETIKSDDYGSRYLIYRRPPVGEEDGHEKKNTD